MLGLGLQINRQPAVSAAWTPAALPGLLLWLDASRITGKSDGDSVSQWDDLSGNSNHWAQATSSKQPTYQTNELNGLPIVRFDGVDDVLTHAGLNVGSTHTVFFVFARTGTSAAPLISAGGAGYDFFNPGGLDAYFFNSSRAENNTGAFAALGAFSIAVYQRQSLRKNGATVSLSGSASAGSNNRTLLGALSAANFATCDIAEVIISTHSLNAATIAQVETYLNAKYAIY